MSNTALERSPEELEIIEAGRAEKQRKEDELQAGLKRDWDNQVQHVTRINEAKRALVDALRAVNQDGVFTIVEETEETKSGNGFGTLEIYKPTVAFVLGGRDEYVRIEEHTPSSAGRYSYNSRSKGYKYHLHGGFNNYCDRWYKNPNTLITRVIEFQDNLESRKQYKIDETIRKETDRKDARNLATKAYPNAQIEVSETSNIVYVKRDDVGTLTLYWVRDYQTKTMKLVYNSVKLADELHTEVLAKFEA